MVDGEGLLTHDVGMGPDSAPLGALVPDQLSEADMPIERSPLPEAGLQKAGGLAVYGAGDREKHRQHSFSVASGKRIGGDACGTGLTLRAVRAVETQAGYNSMFS